MKKSQKIMRLAKTSFAWTILLIVVALVCVATIPNEPRNPIAVGFASLQPKLAIALAGLSIVFGLLGSVFVFYSMRLARIGN